MELTSPRFKEITSSEFPWERSALAFVRDRLPDHEPYRLWSNFELIAEDGTINEVDLLVLTPKGLFLVEIKSAPGIVEGDAGTWSFHHEGKIHTCDNPLLLANRKAKRLKGLLARQPAMRKVRCPWVEAKVFLSHEEVDCRLAPYLLESVHVRDREAAEGSRQPPQLQGIVAALTRWSAETAPRRRLDRPVAKAVTRALEEAGIRPSQRARRVGDYELGELLFEGPGYQDWSARHTALPKDLSRVRVYPLERGASAQARETLASAARREVQILAGIQHEGILGARHYTESERGPALIFDHFPDAKRLDHFLAERGTELSAGQRLELLRQVAEAVHYAHEKHLVHRALAPQSILVLDPAAASPRLKIFNWQTGGRGRGSRGTLHSVSATRHVEELVEDASTVYMAPEVLSERGEAGEAQDVFSLGALAYRLFTGQPPAASFYELTEKLRTGPGLKISSLLDGVPETLQLLVQFATCPAVGDRMDSAAEFLEELEKVEDELTAPEPDPELVSDPTAARAGDRVGHGLTVKRRLGKGSSAVALLVEGRGEEGVLKVALEPRHNERLRAEAEVLEQLGRHPSIVQLREVLELGERVGLLMERAGEETLAQRLRSEGRLALEFLERFGEDLLQVVDWLEEQGIPHRDLKPENLGVAPVGRGKRLHLVLFDFSLARTPAENIRAGTVPYLDPFLALRKPPRWDTHAERFAAAVTLYQMATGQLPRWGDGLSDPAVLEAEATLDAEAFEPALREKMQAFFAKALRRDYRERFDNAQEMLTAWRDVFTAAGEPAVVTDHGEAEAGEAPRLPADLSLATPLVLLGLTTRALNALDRVGASTVEDLLATPPRQIFRMRGVGTKTRRDIARYLEALGQRFPAVERRPAPEPRAEEAPPEPADLSVDALAALVLPVGGRKGSEAGRQALAIFLRLAGEAAEEGGGWPSQSDVAREVGVTRARVSQILGKARRRWLERPALTALREEIAVLLEAQGGVMTAREVAEAVLSRRGSDQAEPLRRRQAWAVVRSALEAEQQLSLPRWIVRRPRDGGRLLVARDEAAAAGEPRFDGERLADWAEALGRRADELAGKDPLLPPDRAAEELQTLPLPAGSPPPLNRLCQLAVAVSRRAALSSRLELYPRGMPAARALKLALGALAGPRKLSPEDVGERIRGRYPDAEPLPGRPRLDRLLEAAGSELRWDGEEGVYVAHWREFTTVESRTSFARTAVPAPRFEEVPSEEAELSGFERRLAASLGERQFLALAVSPKRVLAAERHLAGRFPVESHSFDELLIRHMRGFAAEKKVSWERVLAADAVPAGERAGSRDWANLLRVVRSALPRVREELAASPGPVLLTNPGLLARYGQLSFLDELRDATGRPGGPPGLWLLVAAGAQEEKPTLDGHPVPVFTTAQWARIPEPWLEAGEARP